MNPAWCKLLAVLACHLATLPAHAGTPAGRDNQSCAPAIVSLVGKHAGIKDGGVAVASACKAWPGDQSRLIAAVAHDAGTQGEKQLIVALVKRPTHAVIAAYIGAIPEDAAMTVGSDSLRLDTAPYQLAPGVRAFGLDIDTSYSQGCVDGGLGPERTLFIQDGKTIRPVLAGVYLSSWRYLRGGPSCVDAQEDELIESTSYAIGIAKPVHHGFSSLRISAASDSDPAKPARKARSIELHYDGKTYSRPDFDRLR